MVLPRRPEERAGQHDAAIEDLLAQYAQPCPATKEPAPDVTRLTGKES